MIPFKTFEIVLGRSRIPSEKKTIKIMTRTFGNKVEAHIRRKEHITARTLVLL